MNMFSLLKATVLCGGTSFVVYQFPILAQILFICVMGFFWMSCAHRALSNLRR
jgi:uncharacterized membrane protein YesL